MSVTTQEISFKQIKDGIEIERDELGIAAYALSNERKRAFLENPYIEDDNETMLVLGRVDGVVGGRVMQFPSRFKAGAETVTCQGGSSLKVAEQYRHLALGTELIMNPITKKRHDVIIYADFSEDGVNAYKALRFALFSMEKLIRVQKSRFIFQLLGIKGVFLKVLSSIFDVLFRFSLWVLDLLSPDRASEYDVRQVDVVPNWVDDIVLNDGHKYMEVHDHEWLQWNLDNMFHGHPSNKNRFYIIQKDGENLGFYMTKVRYFVRSSRNIPLLMGTVVEWGAADEGSLTESDIYKLAIKTFSGDVDIVQVVSNNHHTLKKMKKMGFVHRNNHVIAFKDMTKKYKDARDESQWRLRFGYSDSIMN